MAPRRRWPGANVTLTACRGLGLRYDARMPHVIANGLQIEVESLGDASRPAVVLVMGLGMQLIAWPDAFCQALVDAGFRVVRFDNRDIGLSQKIEAPPANVPRAAFRYLLHLPIRAPYTIQDMALDTRGVLDALGIARAHLVGASMGGMIVQNLAATAPERCAGLTSIMSSSGDRALPWSDLRVLRLMLKRPPPKGDFEAQLAHFVRLFRALSGPGFPIDEAALRARLQRSLTRSYHPAGTMRQLLAVVASGDRSALLRRIASPAWVVHGDADPLLPLPHGRDCAAKIRGAQLDVIPGMGHDIPPSLVPVLAERVIAHARSSSPG